MSRPVASLILLSCAALWGLAFLMQKQAMAHMGPLTFVGARYVLGTALVVPLAVVEYRRQRAAGVALSGAQWWRIGALSVAFFLGVWLQQAALTTTSITNGGFITALYVIFTPPIAFLLGRVRPHPAVYVGAPLALAGIFLLTGARLDGLVVGDTQLLACAFCWAAQVVLLGALVVETKMPVFISAVNFFATAVLAGVGALVIEAPSVAAIADGWATIVYSAVLSTALGFTLQAVGQQYLPPANAAIILSTEALFAALAGALVLGERLPPFGYLGAGMIAAAVLVVEALPLMRPATRR